MPLGRLDKPVWSSGESLWLEVLSGTYRHREGGKIKVWEWLEKNLVDIWNGKQAKHKSLGETQHLLSKWRKWLQWNTLKRIQRSRRRSRRGWVTDANGGDVSGRRRWLLVSSFIIFPCTFCVFPYSFFNTFTNAFKPQADFLVFAIFACVPLLKNV